MKTQHVLLTLALALVSCGEKESPTQTGPVDPRIEAVFAATEPEGAVSVIEARKQVEPGATITVTGRIAGAMEPFSKDFATLVLADDSLSTCDREPGDECPTPWDACCVEPKVIAASRLTVQVVGEGGQPVGASLKGAKGLKELDALVVTGKVAAGSSPENLIIDASAIFRKSS